MEKHGGDEEWAKRVYQIYEKEKKDYQPDARFELAMLALSLQNSGCVIDINFLTIEQWQDVGKLKNAVSEYETEKIRQKNNGRH